MKHERALGIHLNERGEVVLAEPRVDARVEVVREDPEAGIYADVDAGRLQEAPVERVKGDVTGFQRGKYVRV